jgi:CRP/FNR family transcriptional regulator, cyclic AMP receptor protein
MARRDAFLDHLAEVSLFSALSRKDLQLVAKASEDVRVDAGRVLMSEGSAGTEFFVIIQGTAKVTRHGRKVATLGPGQAFGELALLDRAPRNATVTAETPMELVVLGQRQFGAIIDEAPGFARKLLSAMASRLREADARSVQ